MGALPIRWFPTLLAVAILALPATASSLTFTDGTFTPTDWDVISVQSGLGGSGTTTQITTGGNPDHYFSVALSVNDPGTVGSQITLVHINKTAIYNPSGGAIASIDYGEDASKTSGIGNGHASTIALRQGGVLYAAVAKRVFTPDAAWTAKAIDDLVESDFRGVLVGALVPDFSSSGSPIEFGFWRAISSPANSSAASRTVGIDNWSVDVTVPEPATGLLFALTASLLALARLRSSRLESRVRIRTRSRPGPARLQPGK